MVSLVREAYPTDGVGKLRGILKIGNQKESKAPGNADHMTEAQISSFRLLPWGSVRFRGLPSASAGFRLLPRPFGRGGFVSFGIISDRRGW